MFNESLKYFWEKVLGENKFNAGIITAAVFVSVVKNSVCGIAVGLSIMLTSVLSAIACSFLSKIIPEKFRLFVYILINGIIVTAVSALLLNVKLLWSHIALIDYIPVLAVSCANIVCVDCPWIERDYKSSLQDALEISITGVILILVYGVLREFLISGCILGISIPVVRRLFDNFHFFEFSSGGFILMGVIAGCMQKIHFLQMDKSVLDDGVKEALSGEHYN